MRRSSIAVGVLVFVGLVCVPALSRVKADQTFDTASDWGGHIRTIGTLSHPDPQSIYQFVDTDPSVDRQAEFRLKYQFFLDTQWIFESHYELVGRQGDTLKRNHLLRTRLPAETTQRFLGHDTISDKHRLMNLTGTISDGDDNAIVHRLDRLNLTYTGDKATLRIGRQALTWGNGLIFNPMDIFNPFAPTAIQRDYKVGEDMLHFQLPLHDGEVQSLYLPRRDIETGDIDHDQSSIAVKWHFPINAMEVDLMVAGHFSDILLGIGASGYLGGAAWRSDIIYTHLDEPSSSNGYWQMAANMDYAWQWEDKNIYGLIEFYHNGLGKDRNYAHALSDPAVSRKTARGELFTLGKTYLAGQLNVQLHPLLMTGATTIVNVADPSTIIQPQLVWDVAANFQLIAGANFNWGSNDTEFGGFDVNTDTSKIKVAPSESQYIWLTYFF